MESHPNNGFVSEQIFETIDHFLLIASIISQLIEISTVFPQKTYRCWISFFLIHIELHVEAEGVMIRLVAVIVTKR